MFITTDQTVNLGTEVTVSLVLPDSSVQIRIRAVVVHARSLQEAISLGKPAGLGVRFLDLSETTLSHIEAYIRERMEADETPSAPLAKIRVVIVDDDPKFRELAAQAFRANLDEIQFAKDGFEAIAICLKNPPDIILSDVHMPRLDGWQLLRLLRARKELAQTLFVFTTSLSNERDRLRAYTLGVDDFLSKPYNLSELKAKISRLLARRNNQLTAKHLQGDLKQVSLASVLSWIEMEQRSGHLYVRSSIHGQFVISSGRIFHANVEKFERTEIQAAFQLLQLTEGEFEFVPGEVNTQDKLHLTTSQLLLENARISDEFQQQEDSISNNPDPNLF